MKNKLFLLLDIDGVLLEAHGYRLAYIDTVNDMLRQMGQSALSIDRKTADEFEASGISAEWDMVPLTLAAFVNWYCSLTGAAFEFEPFPPDCSAVPMTDLPAFRSMLTAQIKEYSRLLDPDHTVIDAVRIGYEKGIGRGLECLLQMPVRDRFFRNTLDPRKSVYFAQLMNRLLGSDTFQEFYGIKAPGEFRSYLAEKDKLLISDHYRELLPVISGKSAFPVVMTYRPTRFPKTDGNLSDLYYVNTPEGECALRLLHWTDEQIPMIGGGSLSYIEEKYGLRREYYVKPHPFHALASMMMSLCRDEIKALETARMLCEESPKGARCPDPVPAGPGEKIRMAVFEDSVTGIESCKNAAAVLRKWGFDAEAVLCGIRTTDEKNQKLIQAGAVLFDNVNDAFDAVLKES